MKQVRHILNIAFLFLVSNIFSQIPNGYYYSAEGLTGENLRSELHAIISEHTVISYKKIWQVFKTSDVSPDGKIWDTYSSCDFSFSLDQCVKGSSNICDCYNREHTVPQSWFKKEKPMHSDIFHILPTDGKMNIYRSNNPYGECSNGKTYPNGKGKLGSSTFPGYSGKVWEPDDEYKGDIARIYFYMATRYKDKIQNWSGASFSGNDLSNWTKELLLKWHRKDPISQKEIDRNNAIFVYQKNRNPFVDNPSWADAIWDPTYDPTYINQYYSNISIFPTPANEYISVSTNEIYFDPINYEIIELSGRLILKGIIEEDNTSIDLSSLSNGLYILKLENSKIKNYTNKIIISK